MATRRARIKAIVNVPARRAKLNEGSANSKPVSSDIDKLPRSSFFEENVVSPDQDVNTKESSLGESASEEKFLPSASFQVSRDSSTYIEYCPNEDSTEQITKECHSNDSVSAPDKVDKGLKHLLNSHSKDSKDDNDDKEAILSSVCKSSPESISDSVIDKVNVDIRNREVVPLNSPLKQRPRLFIRPSPKLVDAGGRGRIPSGSRHKASSESEEETRTRSSTSVTEDPELQVAETSNRSSHSLLEKASKPQETPSINSSEQPGGEQRKNGSRSGRQRARNKENRASDPRRRLWHQMKKGMGAGPFDRTRLTMFDYIYYNPVSNPMRSSSESSVVEKEAKECIVDSDLSSALIEEQVDDPGEGRSLLEGSKEDGSVIGSNNRKAGEEEEGSGLPAPRVKVGPDGELILDEQSLVIETTGLKEGLEDLEKGPALVESSSFTNYSTYSKRTKGLEWSETETLRFYRALNVVGTDFTLMQSLLFPNRSRRDLKNKFKREERRNSSLIEKALRYPGVFSNVEELQNEFAKSDPMEGSKVGSKRGKGRGKSRGGRNAIKQDTSAPAKKRKRRNWLVNGNESEGEESECDENDHVHNDHRKELLFDIPDDKTSERMHISPSKEIFNVSSIDEDVMMASQEIVITNNDIPSGSHVKGEEIVRKSCERETEAQVEEDSDGGDSVSSESQFFSRVLQPTRSGRIPKRREVNNGYQNNHKKSMESIENQRNITRPINVKIPDTESQSLRHEMQAEVIVCSKEAEEGTTTESSRQPLAIELTQCSSNQSLSTDHISGVEPGSLVVIATCAPDDPSHQVLQLFMVSPKVEGEGSLLIPQNLSTGYKLETVRENEDKGQVVSATIVPVKSTFEDSPYTGSIGLTSYSVDDGNTEPD